MYKNDILLIEGRYQMQEIIEYVRKNGRKKGVKKGVLYCGLDPNDDNNVVVGFSMCCSIDKFDYTGNVHVPGFGLSIAKDRAWKWTNHVDYFVQNSFGEEMIEDETLELNLKINPDSSQIVEIPPSLADKLKNFVERSMRYFKDKSFPEWTTQLINDAEYDGYFATECVREGIEY